MAGLLEKQGQADDVDDQFNYPKEWFSLLADRTLHHSLAWDVGTGNGRAAIGLAENYDRVIATDMREGPLKHAIAHPKIIYLHTPHSLSEDDLIAQVGGENSVDLITAAQAINFFDLPRFYHNVVTRVLRKPGGIFAVWCHNFDIKVDPNVDALTNKFHESTLPYWHPTMQHIHNRYKKLPFPFEDVGLGTEGEPLNLDIPKKMSFEGFMDGLRQWSAVAKAKKKGVDLLNASVAKEFETAWGGPGLVRLVVFKAFMLAGSVKPKP